MDKQFAEATFWSFLAPLNEGVILLDDTGAVVYVNPKAQELLQIFYPVHHLTEIYQSVAPENPWERWHQLLTPPQRLELTTAFGDLAIEARAMIWQETPFIQLLLAGRPAQAAPLAEQSREELLSHIDRLEEKNSRLVRHFQHAERMEILAEASSRIANLLEPQAVLEALGAFSLRLTGGLGCAIYRWAGEDEEVELLLDEPRPAAGEEAPPARAFPIHRFQLLRQLIEEQTLVVCRGSSCLPGPPVWTRTRQQHHSILLPLSCGQTRFGAIAIGIPNRRGDLDEEELQALSTLISQAGVALERVRLTGDSLRRERFLKGMHRVGLAINGTLETDRVLPIICRETRRLFAADGVYIWRRPDLETADDGAALLVGVAAEGDEAAEFIGSTLGPEARESLAYQVFAAGEGRLIDRPSDKVAAWNAPAPWRSALAVPLVYQETVIGVLFLVDRRRPQTFSAEDLDTAQTLAVQVAIALWNTDLVFRLRAMNQALDRRVSERTRDLEAERDRVEWLLRVTDELSKNLDEDRVLVRGLELVNEVVEATWGVILRCDGALAPFVSRAELSPQGTARIQTNPLDETLSNLAREIIEQRQGIVLRDLVADTQWGNHLISPAFHAALAVPLIGNGDVIGVLMLFHKRPGVFTEAHLQLVTAAGAHIANAIYNAHLYALIQEQAGRLGKVLRVEKASSAKTQAILESIADGVLVADERGEIILANDAFVDLLGIEREQVLGRPVRVLSGLYGTSGDLWLRTIQQWVQSCGVESGMSSLENTIELLDREKIIRFHLAPVFASGQFFGTVSIFRDITADVEIDRVKTEFVSTVSHELRTPLTVIKGYLDLLLMGGMGEIPAEITHHLKVIQNNSNRLQALVNDLLDISRIETGRMLLKLVPVSLSEIFATVVDGHLRQRIENEGKPLTIDQAIPPDLPAVMADPDRLRQILTNLVDNAFNYTLEGGSIVVSAQNGGDAVRVRVVDNGIGIEPEDLERIFDRFYRVDDVRVQRVSGTGLGLSIVRSLLEMHGGRLEVESQAGRGSAFSFTLPAVHTDDRSMKRRPVEDRL